MRPSRAGSGGVRLGMRMEFAFGRGTAPEGEFAQALLPAFAGVFLGFFASLVLRCCPLAMIDLLFVITG